jgi:hypothetical protein
MGMDESLMRVRASTCYAGAPQSGLAEHRSETGKAMPETRDF